jgi:hypothetical protein
VEKKTKIPRHCEANFGKNHWANNKRMTRIAQSQFPILGFQRRVIWMALKSWKSRLLLLLLLLPKKEMRSGPATRTAFAMRESHCPLTPQRTCRFRAQILPGSTPHSDVIPA